MKFEKPVIGQSLYLVDVGNRARFDGGKQRECEVLKAGRKYFTVTNGTSNREITFHIGNRREKTEYSSNFMLYETKQAYLDNIKKLALRKEISKLFDGYSSKDNISLHELIQIADILDITVD